jgi:N6-L-threonylcarbamoyladenine synthase
MIVLALSNVRFRVLANTRDEAIGRTIDKIARDLRLDWKGRAPGAALEAFCRDGDGVLDENVLRSPLPIIKPFEVPLRGKLEFSFSGLHSAVDRYFLTHGLANDADTKPGGSKAKMILPGAHKLALARAFQSAAFEQLVEKVVLALRWCDNNQRELWIGINGEGLTSKMKHIVVSGGVASNATFRDL